MPNVVAKKSVMDQLLEMQENLESALADVNAALAFVATNPQAANALLKLVLQRGIGKNR